MVHAACSPRMANDPDATEEQVEEEAGEEVFRRLFRLFPLASPHDYFKNGQWQVEMMQIDTDLIEAHRREGGAEEPPPLEEVELPVDMPQVRRPLGLGLARAAALNGSSPEISAGGTVRAFRPAAAGPAMSAYARPAAGTRPAPVGVRPLATAGKAPLTARAPGGNTSQELEQISSFIQTWDLEASKAKLCLARLTPIRRRWVLDNFDGMQALEDYIKECQESNAWGDAAPAAGAFKRPLSTGPAGTDPNKRFRPGGPSAYSSGKGFASSIYSAPRASSYRPAAVGMRPAAAVRPLGYTARPAYAGVRPARPMQTQAGTVYARPMAARPYGARAASPAMKTGGPRPGSLIGNLLRR